jgi:hypothetical protein
VRQTQRLGDRLLLVLEGGARQVEVHLVRAGLRLRGRTEAEQEAGVVGGQQRRAAQLVAGVLGHLPAQDAGPEARQPGGVERVEAESGERAAIGRR